MDAQRPPISCQGCGAAADPSTPRPSICSACPPRACSDCDRLDSIAAACACWVSLDGLPLADIKSLLALADLSVNT